jgi:hypothetical protein
MKQEKFKKNYATIFTVYLSALHQQGYFGSAIPSSLPMSSIFVLFINSALLITYVKKKKGN